MNRDKAIVLLTLPEASARGLSRAASERVVDLELDGCLRAEASVEHSSLRVHPDGTADVTLTLRLDGVEVDADEVEGG